jgi:triosephosphate isomerase
MRKPMLACNWKMYKTNEEARAFIQELKRQFRSNNLELVICSPFTALSTFTDQWDEDSSVRIGAQNMHFEDQGAYTGEISPVMLKALGVTYVILGHSERRTYFHEDDEWIRKKVEAAYRHRLIPILCVGETLDERESGHTQQVVKRQTEEAIRNLSTEQVKQLVIAYEPVWAIGTGRTASPENANEVIAYIRRVVADQFDSNVANEVRILYGGSVKPENIAQFMKESDIDGALVGGASLEVQSLVKMIEAAAEVRK